MPGPMVHIYNPALQVEVGGGWGAHGQPRLNSEFQGQPHLCVPSPRDSRWRGGRLISISMICWIKPFSHMTKSLLLLWLGVEKARYSEDLQQYGLDPQYEKLACHKLSFGFLFPIHRALCNSGWPRTPMYPRVALNF